jgi:hypothetical protein
MNKPQNEFAKLKTTIQIFLYPNSLFGMKLNILNFREINYFKKTFRNEKKNPRISHELSRFYRK